MKTHKYLFLDELAEMLNAGHRSDQPARASSNEAASRESDEEKTNYKVSSMRPASTRPAVSQFAQTAS